MNRFPSWIHRIPEMIETLALAVPNASIGKRRSACLICVPLLTRHSINAGLNARQSSTGIQPRDTGARRRTCGSFRIRPSPCWQEAFFRTARSRQGRADRRGEAVAGCW